MSQKRPFLKQILLTLGYANCSNHSNFINARVFSIKCGLSLH